MLTAEIKVNGRLIGHLHIQRTMPLKGTEYIHSYLYHYYRGGKMISSGTLDHLYSDGAEVLVNQCLSKLKDAIEADF